MRDELDRFEPERDEVLRFELERAAVDRLRDELERFVPPVDDLDRLDAVLRERLDELLDDPFDALLDFAEDRRRELERVDPLRRSAAGISSRATAFASCGICFSRNFAMRSSSRRMPLASFAVSLSPTLSASASIPV